jgi:hypothetical protein
MTVALMIGRVFINWIAMGRWVCEVAGVFLGEMLLLPSPVIATLEQGAGDVVEVEGFTSPLRDRVGGPVGLGGGESLSGGEGLSSG